MNISIKQLDKSKDIPYNLLLLADETIKSINKYIFDCDIYIAEKESTSIAVYALFKIDNSTIEIKNMAVAEEHQSQGIGQLLLKDAEVIARKLGFNNIIIGTGDIATKQLYIYQKAGFVIYDKKQNFFVDLFPEPIYENGIQLKDMIMLKKEL